jgi:hypothetical protein
MKTHATAISPRRNRILDVLQEAGGSLSLREIVERTGLEYSNARTALSEMTTMKLLVRVNRGVYDLPERVRSRKTSSPAHPFRKILLNQQILKVLLNIVITNKALMEALLLGQQEIIRTIRTVTSGDGEAEKVMENLEQIFADRVEWHFNVAAQQVVEQYTKLPAEVLDVLVAPLARAHDSEKAVTGKASRSRAGRIRSDRA